MARASANQKIVVSPASSRRGTQGVVAWKEMERRVAEQIAAKAVRKTQSGRSDIPGAPASARGRSEVPPPASARRTQSGRSDIPPWKQNSSGSVPIPAAAEEDDEEFLETVVKASIVEDPPHSGVRMNEVEDAGARALTFTVYSVEELDARQRVVVPAPTAPPPPPSRWPVVLQSAKALLRTWEAWYKTPKPRPRFMTASGVAIATLRVDLFAALKELPWRKILIRGGIGLASFAFLLVIVTTIAEMMTDDPKPSHALAAKVEVTEVVEAAPAEVVDIELEDDTAAVAEKKPVVSAKKPAKKHAAK